MAGIGDKIKVINGIHNGMSGSIKKLSEGRTPKTVGAVWFQPEGDEKYYFVHADQFEIIKA